MGIAQPAANFGEVLSSGALIQHLALLQGWSQHITDQVSAPRNFVRSGHDGCLWPQENPRRRGEFFNTYIKLNNALVETIQPEELRKVLATDEISRKK